MHAFVTVGSTRFDDLVECAFSPAFLSSLHRKGYRQLVVQCGSSTFGNGKLFEGEGSFMTEISGIRIECWKYKPSLKQDFKRADLVISHAGSGTILDVLRLGKPLIVVPNSTLLDNHQQELASALESSGHLKVSDIPDLAKNVELFDPESLVEFPQFDGSRFARILDEEMGFR